MNNTIAPILSVSGGNLSLRIKVRYDYLQQAKLNRLKKTGVPSARQSLSTPINE